MLTPKQEKFCRKYIELGNASEAYRQSYDAKDMKTETINRNAKALLDNNKIATRVAEIQKAHQKRHEVTVDSLTNELEEARSLAMMKEQAAPMIQASMGKAKIHGLLVERVDVKAEISPKLSEMTREERLEMAKGLAFFLTAGDE